MKLGIEQGRIAHRCCAIVPVRSRNQYERGLGVRLGVLASRRVKENLREGDARFNAEALGVCVVEPPQVLVAGFGDTRCVVDEEGELLGQPSANDRVVLIETQCLGFTRQQFLFDESRHQSTQFVVGRRALPLIGKRLLQPANLTISDMDGFSRGRICLAPVHQCVADEQKCAGNSKVQKGISVKPHLYP